MRPTLVIRDTPEEMLDEAARRFGEALRESVAARGSFHVALAGGSTPEGLYRRLASAAYADLPWGDCHVYFGDERAVGPHDPHSNYRMARQALLEYVPVPEHQVYRLAGEDEPTTAAAAYAERLRANLPEVEGVPVLDLVLLGLGTDGHIASLFLDTSGLDSPEPVTAHWVPSLAAWRLSLTLPVLQMARRTWLLASGSGKAAIVGRALGLPETPPLPVQRLEPTGEHLWLLDQAAAERVAGP
jgi:6-phosphogluconolactonase